MTAVRGANAVSDGAPDFVAFWMRADVYSYAMLLWQLCTGRRPYGDVTGGTRAMAGIVWSGRRPTTADGPLMTRGAAALIQRCWDAAPEQRPAFRDVLREVAGIWPR